MRFLEERLPPGETMQDAAFLMGECSFLVRKAAYLWFNSLAYSGPRGTTLCGLPHVNLNTSKESTLPSPTPFLKPSLSKCRRV